MIVHAMRHWSNLGIEKLVQRPGLGEEGKQLLKEVLKTFCAFFVGASKARCSLKVFGAGRFRDFR